LFEDADGIYAAVPAALGARSQYDVVEVETMRESGSDDADFEPTLHVAFVWFPSTEVFDFLDRVTDGMTLYEFVLDMDLWPDTEATLAATPVDFLPTHGADEGIDGSPLTPLLPTVDVPPAGAAVVPAPDAPAVPLAGATPAPGPGVDTSGPAPAAAVAPAAVPPGRLRKAPGPGVREKAPSAAAKAAAFQDSL